MQFVTMPALKAPDRSGWVEHWLVGPGQEVQAGAVIAEVNTGSTIDVLKSDRSGTIRCLVDERVQCRTGELIARIEHSDDMILIDDRIITLDDLVRHVRPYRTSDDEACREIRFKLRLGALAAIAFAGGDPRGLSGSTDTRNARCRLLPSRGWIAAIRPLGRASWGRWNACRRTGRYQRRCAEMLLDVLPMAAGSSRERRWGRGQKLLLTGGRTGGKPPPRHIRQIHESLGDSRSQTSF
jgi:hypothetical protein